MLEEKDIDKIGQEGRRGEKHLPPVGELFQVPELRFWGEKHVEFFFVLYNS